MGSRAPLVTNIRGSVIALKHRKTAIPEREERNAAPRVMPRLLRRSDAAQYLGLSIATFDALRLHCEIASVPVPAAHREGELLRIPLFDVRDLDALIEKWKEA